MVWRVAAGQRGFVAQQAALVQAPDFGAVLRGAQLGRELAEKIAQIGHVAQQHALGVVVACGVHRLGQVDDDGAIRIFCAIHARQVRQQDVELRQIAVHHTRTQHAHHLGHQGGMVCAGVFGRKAHIVQARGGVTVGIGHQLHQQHAVVKVIGLRHAHASGGQAVERIDLGALPGGFLFLAAKLAALGHGAGRARVFDLAVFGVINGLAEAAVVGLFVDLGAARFVATTHHVDHGFLATHELADHGVDQAFLNEGLQAGGCFHGGILRPGRNPLARHRVLVPGGTWLRTCSRSQACAPRSRRRWCSASFSSTGSWFLACR